MTLFLSIAEHVLRDAVLVLKNLFFFQFTLNLAINCNQNNNYAKTQAIIAVQA